MGQCCNRNSKDSLEITTHFIDINIPPLTFAVEFNVDDTIRFREFFLKVHKKYGEFISNKTEIADFTDIPEGRKLLSNGDLYCGTWKEGKMEGFGECLYSNDDFYSGSFSNNMKNGRGRLISKLLTTEGKERDVIYVGDFIEDKKSGKGKIVYQATHYYDGEWANDKPNGTGEEYWLNPETNKGVKYTGSYLDGMKEGHGRYEVIEDGEVYEGNFHENNKNGFGKFEWKDGRVYEGHWLLNEMDGEGTFRYPDGSVYKGEFVKGKKEGMGEYQWADGIHKYIGNWKEGKRSGYGILYKHKVGELFGEWNNDEFVEKKL